MQRESPFPTSDVKLDSDLCLKTSLSEPVVGLPPAIFSTPDSSASESKITALSNGLRVASEKQFGNFCTVGGKVEQCLPIEMSNYFVPKTFYQDGQIAS